MKLYIENVGKISHADIDLNGITVIAGENDTGKSSVGKILYSIFNSLYRLPEKIVESKEKLLSDFLRTVLFDSSTSLLTDFKQIAHKLLGENSSLADKETFENLLSEYSEACLRDSFGFSIRDKNTLNSNNELAEKTITISDEVYESIVEKVNELTQIEEEKICTTFIGQKTRLEFTSQINNIFDDSIAKAKLTVQNKSVEICFQKNRVISFENPDRLFLNTECSYIDDPFVLDDLNNSIYAKLRDSKLLQRGAHRNVLKGKLITERQLGEVEDAINEIISVSKLEDVISKVNKICKGHMEFDGNSKFVFKFDNCIEDLDIAGISTGIKAFVIIQRLLLNGALEENGTLILDEPEIHLHPSWQLKFAEIIVMLQKELGIHILLNTHSPYFLRAIEVCSAENEIADRCKFYLSYDCDNKIAFEDVTLCTEKIYKKLAQPLEQLQKREYKTND